MFSPNIYASIAATEALVVVDAVLADLQQRFRELSRQQQVDWERLCEIRAAMEAAQVDAAWLQYRDKDLIDALKGVQPEDYLDWLLLLPTLRATRH